MGGKERVAGELIVIAIRESGGKITTGPCIKMTYYLKCLNQIT